MPSTLAKRIRESPQTTQTATSPPDRPPERTNSARTVPPGTELPPLAACDQCCCPALWLDPYGRWHCGCCVPPRSAAQVRGEILLRDDAAGQPYWHDVATDGPAGQNLPARSGPPELAAAMAKLRWSDRLGGFVVADYDLTPYCQQAHETFEAWWARGQRQTAAIEELERSGGLIGAGKTASAATAIRNQPARPPAGVIVYYLTQDRSIVSGQDRRGKPRNPPDDCIAFTWEGAAAWVPVEPKEPSAAPPATKSTVSKGTIIDDDIPF